MLQTELILRPAPGEWTGRVNSAAGGRRGMMTRGGIAVIAAPPFSQPTCALAAPQLPRLRRLWPSRRCQCRAGGSCGASARWAPGVEEWAVRGARYSGEA